MKFLKKTLIILFVILFLAAAALWILAQSTNPETIKNIVTNQLTAATNKKSTITGSLGWQIFPAPAIKITQISLGEKDKDEDYFISVNKLLLSVKIAPLLRGKLVFSDLTLDGATIDINLDPGKKSNPIQPVILKSDQEKSGMQFHIERFLLAHGQMNIHTDGQTLHFKNLKMGIEQFNLRNMPFALQLKAQLSTNLSNKSMKSQISYNGHMSLQDRFFKQFPNNSWPKLDGQLQLKNIQINALLVDSINTNIKTTPEKIYFSPLAISLYGGESVGDMHYSHDNKKLYINQTATNLDGKSLMTALINHERIQGNLDYSIQAEIPLNKLELANLTGKGSLTLKDGSLNKISLAELIEDMNTMLSGVLRNESATSTKKLLDPQNFDSSKYAKNNTPFKFVSIQYLLDRAHLVSESLILQTDTLQIKGEGSLNLANQNIQSRLQVTVSSADEKNPVQSVQKVLGGSFPVILQGTLENPSIEPDVSILNYLLNNISMKQKLVKQSPKQYAKK